MEDKEYIKPTVIRIELTSETEKLYKLENERNGLIRTAAHEWSTLMGVDKSEFWTRALPQQLFDLLESFDHEASKVAAEAYLEFYRGKWGKT